MTTRILHVSDTLLKLPEDQPPTGDTTTAGLPQLVQKSIDRNVDAVLHTGNLFARETPTDKDIEFAVNTLHRLTESDIPVYAIAGKREVAGDQNAMDHLDEQGVITRLTTAKRYIGDDVVVRGVDHVPSEEALLEELDDVREHSERRYSILCLHQTVFPPYEEREAVTTAFNVKSEVPMFLSGIAAGGSIEPDFWEFDKFPYTVTYPGSTNPVVNSANVPTGSLLVVEDFKTATRKQIPLVTTDVEEEFSMLREVCQQTPSEIAELDEDELVDLYGLLAEAKSVVEGRRKEVREEVIDRLSPGASGVGQYAEIQHASYTRRQMKDEDTVLDVVGNNPDVEYEDVSEVSSTKLRELVEEGVIDESDVFDYQERSQVKRVNVDPGSD